MAGVKKSLVELRQIDAEITDFLLSGYTTSQINKHFKETQGFDELYTIGRMNVCQANIRLAANVDPQLMIDLHLQLYEEAWQYFNENDNQFGKNKAMLAKEKLLGVHRENNNVEINNTINLEIQVEEEYDLTKLNEQEYAALQSLLEKSQPKKIEKT